MREEDRLNDSLAQLAPYLASALAVLLSLLNLYLGRRDRSPRLRIRLRYEYRAGGEAAVHDRTQEGLYMRLGEFLREYDLAYPSGTPVVRFAVSNVGERSVHLKSLRLVLRVRPFGKVLVLDPKHGRLRPAELSSGAPVNLLSGPAEVKSGRSLGYRFELMRLSEVLVSEGIDGNVRLVLEITDRSGRVHRCGFDVNTDLWNSVGNDFESP
jgi:hypothetical protein